MNENEIVNINNEILLVGSVYKNPDVFIEYGQYIKSKYDLYDDATRFFYEHADIMLSSRTQTFNQSTVTTYMSEDKDILSTYKKYGGWKTIEKWMNLAILDDVKSYVEMLKKFSLLREYNRNGFDVSKIISHKKFHMFTALDIYKLIRSKADKIQTVILNDSAMEILNEGMSQLVVDCLKKPDMGLTMPYKILNDLLRGLRVKNMISIAMLSNAGKSRFMFKLIAYVTLVCKRKSLVLLNEMSVEEMRFCLLTTVLNNSEFQGLHGIDVAKNEREITLGLYKDDNGNFIYRNTDDNGNFVESIDEYVLRLQKTSSEYNKVVRVANWIEQETSALIYAKDVSSDYSDKSLEFEIRKAKMMSNIDYVFYDTLKNPINAMGDWSALKTTTTILSQLAKQLKIFVYGSVQLTDDSNHTQPLELTSSNIASAKQLKHVLDGLVLCKEIDKQDFNKYIYYDTFGDWGEPKEQTLDLNKRYYAFVVDKNRGGEKKKILFEVDLNRNTWVEVGEVFRK